MFCEALRSIPTFIRKIHAFSREPFWWMLGLCAVLSILSCLDLAHSSICLHTHTHTFTGPWPPSTHALKYTHTSTHTQYKQAHITHANRSVTSTPPSATSAIDWLTSCASDRCAIHCVNFKYWTILVCLCTCWVCLCSLLVNALSPLHSLSHHAHRSPLVWISWQTQLQTT